MVRDFWFALRLFRTCRGTTVLAVLTLSLGIGATTTVYALFDALFLESLPLPNRAQLVQLEYVAPDGRLQKEFSYPLMSDLRDQSGVFASIAAYSEARATIRLGEHADRLTLECVTSDYLAVLGGSPSIGRGFSRQEEAARAPVAVISDALRRRAFGVDQSPLGAPVVVNGTPFTIVGVTPEGFSGVRRGSAPALWIPATWRLAVIGMPDLVRQRGVAFLGVFGLLAPGVRPSAAGEAATGVARRVEENFGGSRISAISAGGGDDDRVQELRSPVSLVMGSVAVLLLMACVNVMHILLARGEARKQEIAVRLAVGASRVRVLRQLLAESGVLAGFGLAGAVLIATWGIDLLPSTGALRAAGVSVSPRLNLRVLGVAATAALLTAVIAGLVPAWRAARVSVAHTLGRGDGAVYKWRTGSALAVAQISLSVLLLAAAGLFARSLWQLKATETNLAANRVLTLQTQFGMDVAASALWPAQQRALAAVESLPGVLSTAAANTLPVSASGMQLRFDARTTVPVMDADVHAELQFVSPKYFAATGLPLVGRAFAEDEGDTSIIVNENFARRYWPHTSAVGQTFTNRGDTFRVVGVARNSKYRRLDESVTLVMYRPIRHFPTRTLAVLLRTSGEPLSLAHAVRRQLQAVAPEATIWNVGTLDQHIEQSLELDRARSTTLAVFAVLSLLLVCLGVYGVMSHVVAHRVREIGIRLALGARPRTVRAIFLRRAVGLSALGLIFGVPAIQVTLRLVSAELHGVAPYDPYVVGLSCAVIVAVALAATYAPASRASRVDPMAVLK